jgi:hypothetical protein
VSFPSGGSFEHVEQSVSLAPVKVPLAGHVAKILAKSVNRRVGLSFLLFPSLAEACRRTGVAFSLLVGLLGGNVDLDGDGYVTSARPQRVDVIVGTTTRNKRYALVLLMLVVVQGNRWHGAQMADNGASRKRERARWSGS